VTASSRKTLVDFGLWRIPASDSTTALLHQVDRPHLKRSNHPITLYLSASTLRQSHAFPRELHGTPCGDGINGKTPVERPTRSLDGELLADCQRG